MWRHGTLGALQNFSAFLEQHIPFKKTGPTAKTVQTAQYDTSACATIFIHIHSALLWGSDPLLGRGVKTEHPTATTRSRP